MFDERGRFSIPWYIMSPISYFTTIGIIHTFFI